MARTLNARAWRLAIGFAVAPCFAFAGSLQVWQAHLLAHVKPETIPASELLVADEAASHKPSSAEIFHILAKRVYRGLRIGQILCTSLSIVSGAFFAMHHVSWGIATFAVAFPFGMGLHASQRRLDFIRLVCAQPTLVYWAHPTVWRQRIQSPIRSRTVDHTFINLHARTGHCFNIGMSREEMLAVIAWLHHENPAIRLGEYDGVPDAESTHDV